MHEAIYSMLMLDRGFLAESANINDLVEEADGMNILTKRHDGEVDRVMSNSFIPWPEGGSCYILTNSK